MLHSHGEIIELNPLVIEHHPVQAPRDAPQDEFFSVWNEITENLQYIPGISGKMTFKGVFHNMPWGLQTHIYAPAGVDLRNKYQIKGNQPGEPRIPRELGDEGPTDGLYLQEDVEITCSFAIAAYVKKNVQKASAMLIARMLTKAELLDAGELHAMVENGKLKTFNPALQNQLSPLEELQLPSPMALHPDEMPDSAQMSSTRDSYYPQPLRVSKQPDYQDEYVAPKNFAAEMP